MSAAIGADILLHAAAVSQQTNAITAIQRDLDERKSGVDRIIQFRESRSIAWLPDLRAQQAPGIEHQPDVLAALHLKYARDQVPPSRRRGPGNVAQLVAFSIFPQTVELAPHAALPPPPLFQVHLTAANQIQCLSPGLFEIRKYAHGLLCLCHRPPLSQP